MNVVLIILFMMIIGAMIGGFTNSLAIKMLFRPYKPLYIGRWRVPFTPGLIPKRREELADQLGKMVVNHLLTAEGIQKKFQNASFIKELTVWIQTKTNKVLESEQSVEELVNSRMQVDNISEKLERKTSQFIEDRFERWFVDNREQKLSDVLPEKWIHKVDQSMPELTDLLLGKGIEFLKSPEGKERLSIAIDRFLSGRGTLGNMISMFLGNDRLVDKVQPELIKFLEDHSTQELVEGLLKKEWLNVQALKVSEIEQKVDRKEIVDHVKRIVSEQIPVFGWLSSPVREWSRPYKDLILEKWIPKVVEAGGQLLSESVGEMLDKLHLADIVRDQVETFAVERLEEMVLSISKREFKMITYLGALLGGSIGFIQGVILLLFR